MDFDTIIKNIEQKIETGTMKLEYINQVLKENKIEDTFTFIKTLIDKSTIISNYLSKFLHGKTKYNEEDISFGISADLMNQLTISNFVYSKLNIPFLGVYTACATSVEQIIIASTFIDSKKINNCICTTSSHNLVSEKQFRFPIEYGAIRKKVNTFTATSSVSAIVTNKKTNLKLESATIGSVVDIGYKDANNFGAVMAPAAAKTIYEHFKDTKRKPSYYDLILTGDLGIYGLDILKEYLEKEYKLKVDNLMDAGALLYKDTGSSIAGASGPTCLPLILKENKYKKILMVGTGALHSKTTVNIGLSIPSVSHAVSLEVISI